MTNSPHNGWFNKETWNMNITYQDLFENMAMDQNWDCAQDLADAFESIVNELEYDILPIRSLAKDAVGLYLAQVNWLEIAEHHYADFCNETVALSEE